MITREEPVLVLGIAEDAKAGTARELMATAVVELATNWRRVMRK
jgi:hypothetical protein